MSIKVEQLVLDANRFIERTEDRIERLRFHIAHLQRQKREVDGAQRMLNRAELQLQRLLLYRSTLVSVPGLHAYMPPEIADARRFARL
jgi:hypothetical protein